MAEQAATAPTPRRFGAVNWRGLWSLYHRNVVRFFRFGIEQLGGPAVSSLLFLAVFDLALGGGRETAPGVTLSQFIAPGIVMISMIHSAFENAAAYIVYDKLDGMIGDILSAPLKPAEIVAGFALSAATSALCTGAVVLLLMSLFVELPVHSPAAVLGFALAAALLFAFFGTIVGLWADRWDNYSAAETFLILPLGLLSGAFFPLQAVAPEFRWIFEINPVFHAVEGFRYGFTGQAQGAVAGAAAILALLILALALLSWRLVAAGYKLKA